ncbi:MAG: hypothetical protein GX555_04820 [Actinomycetales bacterium]|nr:hypothetical protein [Actinomycetales bacterium]
MALQRLAGNSAVSETLAAVQRDGESDAEAGAQAVDEHVGEEQLRRLLTDLPVDTPEQVSRAETVFGHVLTVLEGGASGATSGPTPIPLAAAPFNAAALVQALREGEVDKVVTAILPVVGDAALATQLITEAGVTLGAFSVEGGLSTSAVVATTAGAVAEIAGPAALAVAVMVGVFSIPSDVNEDRRKIWYIGDVSGILTSWIWADPTISPHEQLSREAPTAGFFDTDLSDAVRAARVNAERVWAEQFQGRPERIRATRDQVGDDYQVFWRALGTELESQLQPSADGSAVSNINRLIRGVALRRRQRRREQEQADREERFRLYGGTIVTEDGFILQVPGDLVETP